MLVLSDYMTGERRGQRETKRHTVLAAQATVPLSRVYTG